ncbi:amylosucrase [Scytonema sp. HK-05]|uniref:amylosucrase n=1 Tax=Scytonema sp. HK-05 TaxID=1137095 RepID=UPI001E5D423A|nr:amylosucrase [Scytonema sp. HK-05]
MSSASRSVFEALTQRLAPALAARCAPRDVDLFLIRLERYFEDLYLPLVQLYGEAADWHHQFEALFAQMVDAYAARPEPLRLLDLERQCTPDWFGQPNMVGYVCYSDLFAGTLTGVRERVSYLQELGVTYLHLMPVLKARPGASDGGYAVMDYRAVNPALGNMADLQALASELHKSGISLCIDLVINHTAKEHEWAQGAIAGEEKYLNYYYTFPDRTLPDAYEHTLPEVFPDFAPGNFSWYPAIAESGRWVWTTFNEFQWDLNYTNPTVFREMLDIMFFLANQGVDILRLDAVPFIWKRMGTNCQNEPEVYLLIQAFRGLMRVVAPAVIFKAEAITPPKYLLPYLGVKNTVGKECELAYNNQLMVLLWSTLATRKVTLMTHVLHDMPRVLLGSTWITYIRNHDDIGWAITDEDAAAVGENGFLHRQFLIDFYNNTFPGSFAKGALFQYNPVTRDARISGTTASLAGLEAAVAKQDDYEIDLAVRRILLLHSIIMVYGGIPLIYMGDELGLFNDRSYLSDSTNAEDNRWMHRPPMDWTKAKSRHDSTNIVGRIYKGLLNLLAARKYEPALHYLGLIQPMWTDNDHVFALLRRNPKGRLLLLANFHESEQSVTADLLQYSDLGGNVRNLLAEGSLLTLADGRIHLAPYESMWLAGDK